MFGNFDTTLTSAQTNLSDSQGIYWMYAQQPADNNYWQLYIDSIQFGSYGNSTEIDMAYVFNDRFLQLPW